MFLPFRAHVIKGVRADQEPLALMDVVISRNAYGRQVDSFETKVPFVGVPAGEVGATFIRAPRFEELGSKSEVLSFDSEGEPLAVREGRCLAVAFHPELTEDVAVHEFFTTSVVGT